MAKSKKLPTFAFLEGWGDDNELEGRNVVYHTSTATVMEIFERAEVTITSPDVVHREFETINRWGATEAYVIAVHYSATFDVTTEDGRQQLMHIMREASEWFADYADWEDNLIIEEEEEDEDGED